jgi:hypothetical protein
MDSITPSWVPNLQGTAHFLRAIVQESNIIALAQTFAEICFAILLLDQESVARYTCQTDPATYDLLPNSGYLLEIYQVPCGQIYYNDNFTLAPDLSFLPSSVNQSTDASIKGIAIWTGMCKIQDWQAWALSQYRLFMVLTQFVVLVFFNGRDHIKSLNNVVSKYRLRVVTLIVLIVTTVSWYLYEIMVYVNIEGFTDVHCWLPANQFFRFACAGYLFISALYVLACFSNLPVDKIRDISQERKIRKKHVYSQQRKERIIEIKRERSNSIISVSQPGSNSFASKSSSVVHPGELAGF